VGRPTMMPGMHGIQRTIESVKSCTRAKRIFNYASARSNAH
jgi:hypothetical protein